MGGECIAVDPYYIINLARKKKLDLPLIHLARKTNESMVDYVYNNIIKKLSSLKIEKLAFFGVSYKENCSQITNSMYLKLAKKLNQIYSVDIYDHLRENVSCQLNLKKSKDFDDLVYDAIIIGSKHNEYKKFEFKSKLNKSTVIVDIHGVSLYSENVIL